MLYVIIIFVAVFSMASLAVDYGRVQLTKTELRRAADAAARAASQTLGSVADVQNTAAAYVGYNASGGEAIPFDKNKDVEFGDWNTTTRVFTVLTGSARNNANAIRVTCKRTVPLVVASAVGKPTFNVTGVAIAAIIPPGFGLVGINYIKLNGNSSASYWSSTGTVAGNSGNVASNGNISSTGNSTIQGTLWTQASATVTGVTANARRTLTTPLNYANGSSGSVNSGFNNNANITGGHSLNGNLDLALNPNKTATLPAGSYYFRDVSISNNGEIVTSGEVTIYFYGTMSISGKVTTAGNKASNLKIIGIPNPSTSAATGNITLGTNSAVYADIYAPQSAITMSGSGAIYGAVLGKSIDMTGTSDIYYDLSMAGGDGVVKVVQ